MIQSHYIFGDNLFLFGVLYLVWALLLILVLMSSGRSVSNVWEGFGVVMLFTLVFLGFWDIIAPQRYSDGMTSITALDYISSSHSLDRYDNIGYQDYPGLHIIGSAVHQTLGVDLFAAVSMVLVGGCLAFAGLVYAVFLKVLKEPILAAIGALLVIEGTWMLSKLNHFYPGNLGLVFMVAMILILYRRKNRLFASGTDTVIIIILLFVASMTHFITSLGLLFLLVGVGLIQRIKQFRFASATPDTDSNRIPDRMNRISMEKVGIIAIILALLMPLTWTSFWSTHTFGVIANITPRMQEAYTESGLLGYIPVLAKSNLGERIPFWANSPRMFWLVFIYGLGGILVVRTLIRFRKLGPVALKETGCLLGIGGMAVLGAFATQGGFEAKRFLMYAPLFMVPILLRPVLNLNRRHQSWALGGLGVTLIVLSLPSFLAYNPRIMTDTYYPSDFSTGAFAADAFDTTDRDVSVYSASVASMRPMMHYVYDASYERPARRFEIMNEENLWKEMDQVVGEFDAAPYGLYILSDRMKVPFAENFGVELQDREWVQLENAVNRHQRIYDDGFDCLLLNEGNPAIRMAGEAGRNQSG